MDMDPTVDTDMVDMEAMATTARGLLRPSLDMAATAATAMEAMVDMAAMVTMERGLLTLTLLLLPMLSPAMDMAATDMAVTAMAATDMADTEAMEAMAAMAAMAAMVEAMDTATMARDPQMLSPRLHPGMDTAEDTVAMADITADTGGVTVMVVDTDTTAELPSDENSC